MKSLCISTVLAALALTAAPTFAQKSIGKCMKPDVYRMTTLPVVVTVRNTSGLTTTKTAVINVNIAASAIPLSWNDPKFSGVTTSSGVSVANGGTVSNKSIAGNGTAGSGLYNGTASVVGLGSFTINNCRIKSQEGVRIGGSGGNINISNSYIETTGLPGDHADGIQVYGPSHVNVTVSNTMIVSHNHDATSGFFSADGTDGTFTFNNVVFDGGPYGLRINADAGPGHEYNVALKDVYFIQGSFGYAPYLIYVPPGYTGAQLNITQWDNVRWATIVNGVLVPGALIPRQ